MEEKRPTKKRKEEKKKEQDLAVKQLVVLSESELLPARLLKAYDFITPRLLFFLDVKTIEKFCTISPWIRAYCTFQLWNAILLGDFPLDFKDDLPGPETITKFVKDQKGIEKEPSKAEIQKIKTLYDRNIVQHLKSFTVPQRGPLNIYSVVLASEEPPSFTLWSRYNLNWWNSIEFIDVDQMGVHKMGKTTEFEIDEEEFPEVIKKYGKAAGWDVVSLNTIGFVRITTQETHENASRLRIIMFATTQKPPVFAKENLYILLDTGEFDVKFFGGIGNLNSGMHWSVQLDVEDLKGLDIHFDVNILRPNRVSIRLDKIRIKNLDLLHEDKFQLFKKWENRESLFYVKERQKTIFLSDKTISYIPENDSLLEWHNLETQMLGLSIDPTQTVEVRSLINQSTGKVEKSFLFDKSELNDNFCNHVFDGEDELIQWLVYDKNPSDPILCPRCKISTLVGANSSKASKIDWNKVDGIVKRTWEFFFKIWTETGKKDFGITYKNLRLWYAGRPREAVFTNNPKLQDWAMSGLLTKTGQPMIASKNRIMELIQAVERSKASIEAKKKSAVFYYNLLIDLLGCRQVDMDRGDWYLGILLMSPFESNFRGAINVLVDACHQARIIMLRF